MHIFSFRYRLSQVFMASTMSLPCPGAPIILSMLMLKLDESKERKYKDAPQRYCLQQPSVLYQIVHFGLSFYLSSIRSTLKSYVRGLLRHVVYCHPKGVNDTQNVHHDHRIEF